MRDRFSEIHSFLKIAEAGSLSIAARRLGLSLPATSRRLTQLETRLGVPLIRRNSRHLTLTDEGLIFYEKAGLALAEIENAEQAVKRGAVDPSGSLRVVTTLGFGRRRLAPVLQRYSMLHPDVTVHLETSDQMLSIVETGHDLAICFDQPPDSGLIMKRLADNPRILCASPDYLARRGRPGGVSDLIHHDLIIVRGSHQDLWRQIGLGDAETRQTLNTNDGELARIWALDGAGIVIKSLWDVSEDIDTGRLEAILPAYALPAKPVVALYTPAQGETAKLRSCLRFLSEALNPAQPVPLAV